MRRLALFFFVALASVAQAATLSVTTDVEHPVAGDPINLRVEGYCISNVTAVRNGRSIEISATNSICDPPFPNTVTVPIGALPPGRYEAHYRDDDGTVIAFGSFTVSPRKGSTLTVHPFAVPSTAIAPIELRLTSNRASVCPNLDCTVRVGGVVVPKRAGPDGSLLVPAPPHAVGYADVVVEQRIDLLHGDAAIYYFDPAAPPDLALFERVLFPVLFNAPGANGSDWRSEVVISNSKPWFVETFNDIHPGQCIDYPCGQRLAPQSKLKFSGGNHPHGVALLVPRAEADDLAFALRIRDVSRAAEGFGTEIPVLRESDLFRDTLTLLDVPLESRYRVKLRVYTFDERSTNATLITHDWMNGTRTRTPLTLTRTCNSPQTCAAAPAYAELDLPSSAASARVNLYVELPTGALGWAFATVTNNATQQVTIITADGTGGEPCTTCTTP